MPLYRNGGYIGSSPTTSDDSASGVWTLDDHLNRKAIGAWPDTISADPYWANVVYLARYENNLTDQKGNLSVGSVGTLSYTTTKKFGTYAYNKVSGNNYLTLAGANNTSFAFGTGDFTVEYWIQFTGNPPNGNNFTGLCSNNQTNGTPGGSWSIYQGVTASNQWRIGWYNGNAVTLYQHSTLLNPGQWYHLAYCRASGTQYVAVNGVVENKGSNAQNITTGGGSRLGNGPYNEYGYNAYFDEVRVTKGVARYTSNFSAPTTRFANY